MAKVTELVAVLAAPIAEQNGCTLWDVEYVREAGQWFLRVYIDKPEVRSPRRTTTAGVTTIQSLTRPRTM